MMTPVPRGVRIGVVVGVAALALLGLRVLNGRVTPGTSPSPTAAPVTSSPSPLTGPFPAANFLGTGQGLGVTYQIAGFQIDGVLCVDLAVGTSVSGSCGRGPLTRSLGADALWFGPAPAETTAVWANLVDGRVLPAELYDPPTGSTINGRAYVFQVANSVDGVVVAVGPDGRMIDFEYQSADVTPDRPLPVVDMWGNVIGYGTQNDYSFFLTPGDGLRHSDRELRPLLRSVLLDPRPEIRAWWRARPPLRSDAASIARWWSAYPVRRTLENSSLAFP